MKILAIIPARGGSVRLPGKNIRVLGGKPLIEWSIDAARKVSSIDKIFVSTDCNDIADVCRQTRLDVPVLRPKNLAGDKSSTIDVVKHTIEYLKERGEIYDFVLLLQPTSPLRSSDHVRKAIDMISSKKADAVISVCKCEHSPLWTSSLPSDFSMTNFLDEKFNNIPSQELPVYYRLNGAIFLVNIERLYEEETFLLSSNSYGIEMDAMTSVDIDNEIDFLLAETIIKQTAFSAY
ncbi:acylneuraminate cytidylyltransferase family protein [Gammaproteobacteria bacterium]|nr:acylneuraminate cytidylyltransferase family protein [Gammaproteobacteria bacterium]